MAIYGRMLWGKYTLLAATPARFVCTFSRFRRKALRSKMESYVLVSGSITLWPVFSFRAH